MKEEGAISKWWRNNVVGAQSDSQLGEWKPNPAVEKRLEEEGEALDKLGAVVKSEVTDPNKLNNSSNPR